MPRNQETEPRPRQRSNTRHPTLHLTTRSWMCRQGVTSWSQSREMCPFPAKQKKQLHTNINHQTLLISRKLTEYWTLTPIKVSRRLMEASLCHHHRQTFKVTCARATSSPRAPSRNRHLLQTSCHRLLLCSSTLPAVPPKVSLLTMLNDLHSDKLKHN